MLAKRISGYEELDTSIVCYWKADDHWLLYIPNCGLGDLRNHTVIENEDKTITVTPSILVTGHNNGNPIQVHGFLTDGIWKSC